MCLNVAKVKGLDSKKQREINEDKWPKLFFFYSLLYLAHELCEEINFYGDSYALQSIDL